MARKRSDPIDRLLDDVADRETQRRIAWARSLENVPAAEKAALVRVLRDGPHKSSSPDLRLSLALLDRLVA